MSSKLKTKVEGHQKVRSIIDPPKRPMSAYFQYLQDIREDLFKQNKGSSVAEISKLAGEQWRNIDPASKSYYQKKADVAKEEYEVVKTEYERKHGSIKKARRRKQAEKFGTKRVTRPK